MGRMSEIQGRRRKDTSIDRIPDNLEHGDYWKVSDFNPDEPSNLTKTAWRFYFNGYGVMTLTKHTVRENEDETISVLPDDGSSNSIGIHGAHGAYWHGYIYDGVFKEQ